jgi:hypothetical protein
MRWSYFCRTGAATFTEQYLSLVSPGHTGYLIVSVCIRVCVCVCVRVCVCTA